ncbi:MAG: 30S ribosomal protein S16 [bacterium]
MAVHLRLRRMGSKKRPFYRIVAADSRRARDGRFIETLGTYNPITVPAEVKVVEDKIVHWLNEGAEPSDTVLSLLKQIGFTVKYEKIKRGEDVSEIELKTIITERPKKTRKHKKAVAKAAEEKSAAEAKAKADAEAKAKAQAEAKAKAEADAAAAAETPADEASPEEPAAE